VTLVVDASAAYGFLISDRWDAILEHGNELIAPDLIVAELLNARWKALRAGHLAPEPDAIFEFLARVRIMPSLPHAASAVRLSERLGHPIYDCFYVAIAQQANVKLLTSDAHLTRKLRSHKLGSVLV
jgi:predicted nucleic acid-binding protein